MDRASFDAALSGLVLGPNQIVDLPVSIVETGVGLSPASTLWFTDGKQNFIEGEIIVTGAGTVLRIDASILREPSGTYTLISNNPDKKSEILDRAYNAADLTVLDGLQFTVSNPQVVVVHRLEGQSGADFTADIDAAVVQAVAAAANGPVSLRIEYTDEQELKYLQDPGYLSTQALQALQATPGIIVIFSDSHALRSSEITNTAPLALLPYDSVGNLENNPALQELRQSVDALLDDGDGFARGTFETFPGPMYLYLETHQTLVGSYLNIYRVDGRDEDTAPIVPLFSHLFTDEYLGGPVLQPGSYFLFFSDTPLISSADPADTTPTPAASPQTGDSSNMGLWAALGTGSLAGLAAGLALWMKRRRRQA